MTRAREHELKRLVLALAERVTIQSELLSKKAEAMTTIPFGYQVGTGTPVSVPLRHMVITGQTQEAGKTTALEALIKRSKCKALAFVTKRGEGSFANGHHVDPYFREQADWQFVASLLEASRGEKLRFERAWIIRASKGAHTLADVQKNVRKAMETAKGMSADVYLTLDAYLDVVVPQIAGVQWASRVSLRPGVNVMDLTALDPEMQHLVIRSSIDWVLNKETDTVVVVPEAWKFIPQGRGTPVKLAAEAYIRQAAGLRNYLWLDSQDIAGVEKIILKSVPLWILGVQRESNEVKRTLDQIPAGTKKPKPEQVATLGLGHFYVCHGTNVIHAYAQPEWMEDDKARQVAMGGLTASSFARVSANPSPQPGARPVSSSLTVDARLDRLTEAVEKLVGARAPAAPPSPVPRPGAAPPRPPGPPRVAPPPAPGGFDEEELYQRIKARLMAEGFGGSGPMVVTPPEKLRNDFQREEVDRIIAAVRELEPLTKRVMKFLEGIPDEYCGQAAIAARLDSATGGALSRAIAKLASMGWVETKNKVGVKTRLRDKIADDLSTYKPTAGQIEVVYQNILTLIAEEES